MSKIAAIVWKDLYTTFTDRSLLVIMLAAPLAIATIVGLAFGGMGGGDIPIDNISVVIVNQDEGSDGQNYGSIIVSAFVPTEADGSTANMDACELETSDSSANGDMQPISLTDLTTATLLDDPAAARAGVESGDYTAAIIIPADFSQKISYGQNDPIEPSTIEIYANSGRPIPAGIIHSIVESFTSQIATGNIAIAATIETLIERAQERPDFGIQFLAASSSFQPNFACVFVPAFNPISIERQTVAGEATNATVFILVLIGSAQAMFFALFTAQGAVSSITEERRNGTLQRLLVSPTPQVHILIGKMLATFVTVVFQLLLLTVALTVIASIFNGGFIFIWGSDYLSVALVILAAALAVSGIGALLIGFAKTPEQGQLFGSVINIVLGILGGAFVQGIFPPAVAGFSMIYWGTDAFRKLAQGSSDIGLNVLVLVVQGAIMFAIGFWLFNRRMKA
ncbi:MAG: ABC transporter permease [Burkholderiales bacterium]|nr:ABC transporter permease [Anaerolineae bacterium]